MSQSAIKLTNIKKSYGKHLVLTDVTLDIEKGGIYGMIGKNGAGKSTLFKVILGLSDYQAGTVEIEGSSKNLDEARKNIGFLIGSNFFGYMNAKENLKYYARLKKIANPLEEADRVLKIVGLEGVHTEVKGFSLGMRQRLGIACAILGNPDIVILDEPTNGLDPQGIMDIRNLIKSLNEQYGMTIIVSSHILGELQHTADKFAILNEGTIVRELTQEDLMVEDRAVRIDVDQVERAREVLAREGIKILGETRETRSLEDYYFSLIGGGEKNA